jgi:hypothetical protein
MSLLHFLQLAANACPRYLLACWLVFLLPGCSAERWTDEAKLHDGTSIDVERSVSMTNFVSLSDGRLFTPTPTIYGLSFRNPNTQEKLSWRSEDEFVLPVLLDFDGSVSYLVILLPRLKKPNIPYDCPWPPYIFLRHDQGGGWKRIQATEAPAFLRTANLSRRYDSQYMKVSTPGKSIGYQTINTIASRNAAEEGQYEHYFQVEIPRTRKDWLFKQQAPNCVLVY